VFIFWTTNGLNIKKGPISELVLKVSPELLTNSPGYIYIDKKQLWLSNNSGVYVIDFNGKVKQLLKDIDVNQVIKDRNQNIWFTTKNGIYRLPDPKERLYIFGKDNGLSSNVFRSLTKDDNRLWIGIRQ
jgi:ligand-binding sensor domain-containing protein